MRQFLQGRGKAVSARAAWLLAAALIFGSLPSFPFFTASCVQAAVVQEDDAVSLKYVSSVTADTEGSVLRIYGDAAATYNNPITVTANCTVILDNIKNDADLTVSSGKQVRLILRGTNRLGNIRAVGGSATTVRIEGESGSGTLTAGNIACAAGGTAETGAVLIIDGCTVMCQNLGCGSDGTDAAYWDSSATKSNPTPGSNASPQITISGANLSVSGSVACGGDGVFSSGTWTASASAGGSSGEVSISSSYVSIGGDLAVGGTGGKGQMRTSYYNCTAGMTKSSSPVTITDHSNVNVTGNVATQPDLPQVSDSGTQSGLDGVTVTVIDSALSAKDIASGGAGHVHVHYGVYSGSGTSYNIYGTAGGNGGTLLAENAEITCETAVCGADAGDYMNYEVSIYGTKSGDVDSENHPQDGRGGSIRETNSSLTVTAQAGDKGSRWDDYPNPSAYSDSTFIGGTLRGNVYGDVITTDITAILSGDFVASTDIRNSEESSCAKCTLKTAAELAGKSVNASANSLTGTVLLDGEGSLHTYLGIGKEVVKLTGSGVYSGTFMVKRTASLNVFQLEPYGIINVAYGGAVIRNNSYTYTNESYDYDGAYTVSGSSEDAVLTVEEGDQTITLSDTSFDELSVNGTSHVTLVLSGDSAIQTINVGPDASLTIEGSGSLHVDTLGNEHGASGAIEILSGSVAVTTLGGGEGSSDIVIADSAEAVVEESSAPLRDSAGNLLYPVRFVFHSGGTYTLYLNGSGESVTVDGDEGTYTRLLAEGAYTIQIDRAPFCFRGNVTVKSAQTIYLDDLILYLDGSGGDIIIGEQTVSLGTDVISTQADVQIYQSGEAHAVCVEKNTASIVLDGVRADTQIYLPEDFDGLIVDANHAPVQVVTIRTGCANRTVKLYLDENDYEMTTNAQGNFSIIAARGIHTLGVLLDGALYKGQVSISSTENVFSLSDLALVWDIGTGDLKITDGGFEAEGVSGCFDGNYMIVQSGENVGTVTVEKDDAHVFLSGEVDSFVQIKVPENFNGSIFRDETSVYPLVIATGFADCDLQVTLDGKDACLHTDADGKIYLVAEAGKHRVVLASETATYVFHADVDQAGVQLSLSDLVSLTLPLPDDAHGVTVTVGDISVEIGADGTDSRTIYIEEGIDEIFVTDGDETYRYPIVDGTLGEAEEVYPTASDKNDADGTEQEDSEKSDSERKDPAESQNGDAGNVPDGADADTQENAGGIQQGTGSSSGVSGSSGATGSSGKSGTQGATGSSGSSGTQSVPLPDVEHPSGEDTSEPVTDNSASKKPVIHVSSSLTGVELVKRSSKNTYKTYSKKKVTLTVEREEQTDYYYKIAKKGQKPSSLEWKKLTADCITVENSDSGQRVYIKAINATASTVKKTTGFWVDTKKPMVAGVKNMAFYSGKRTISVSDNSGAFTVKLNGKKMPAEFTVNKKGIFCLTVTDRAGNKRVVFFAIK